MKDLNPKDLNAIIAYKLLELVKGLMSEAGQATPSEPAGIYSYASMQATNCAVCGEHKHTPLKNDEMGGYVCLTCIDRELIHLQSRSIPPTQ